MAAEDNEPEEDEVYCIDCGESIAADAGFCPECGAKQQVDEKTARRAPTAASDASSEPNDSTADNLGRFASWGIGGLFVLVGVVGAVDSLATGIIVLLLGLFLLPPVRARLEERVNYEFARWMVVGVFLVGMIAAGAVAPDTDDEGGAPNPDVEDRSGAPSGESTPTSEPQPEFAVRIIYSGSWQGALSVTGGGSSQSESVSGTGTEMIEITGDVDIISVNAQKQDDSTEEITVQILHDGEVVSEASTSSAYGVAQTGQSFT